MKELLVLASLPEIILFLKNADSEVVENRKIPTTWREIVKGIKLIFRYG